MKEDLTKIFIDENFSESPKKKNFPWNRVLCNHIEEIWSIDLVHF